MKRAILSAVLFLLAGCNVRHRVSDAGKFIDGVYRNDLFGIIVNVPDDLSVKTREDME